MSAVSIPLKDLDFTEIFSGAGAVTRGMWEETCPNSAGIPDDRNYTMNAKRLKCSHSVKLEKCVIDQKNTFR